MSNPRITIQNNKNIDSETRSAIEDFDASVMTYEKEYDTPLLILFDKKSEVYYTECHISTIEFNNLNDTDAVIDPENQEEYRSNRELQPNNPDYILMREDAKQGRQFSDIVVEYNYSYKKDKPLKILGGQHRAKAIENESPGKAIHGIRVYFNLSKDQRAEIAIVSNTNIAISPDLLDRMEEQRLSPANKLRNLTQEIGFLEKKKDFGDMKSNKENLPTVRLMRTFVVNFFRGKEYAENYDESAIEPYLCSSGGIDKEYKSIFDKIEDFTNKVDLVEAGKSFVKLHKKQYKICSEDDELKKVKAYRMKALSLAIVSAWAMTAGLLQNDSDRKNKFYELPDKSGKKDPLNAIEMAKFNMKGIDVEAYRGLGARADAKERGRLTMIFLTYSNINEKNKIDKNLLHSAVSYYHGNKFIEAGNQYASK